MQFRHFVKLAIKIADCRWWWARFAVTCSHLTNLTSGQGFHKLCWNAWMKAEARITPYNLTVDSWRCRFKVLLTPYIILNKCVSVCVCHTFPFFFLFFFARATSLYKSLFCRPYVCQFFLGFWLVENRTLHCRGGHWGW